MGFFDFFTDFWKMLNSENNDPIVVGMIGVMIALILTSVRSYFNCRKLIKEKDDRIRDLREERNKFQDIVLKKLGGNRKSSKS